MICMLLKTSIPVIRYVLHRIAITDVKSIQCNAHMIIAIIGGIGSGKTITAVKEIVERSQSNFPIFTNFSTRNINKVRRLKVQDIVTGKGTKMNVNYAFFRDSLKKYNRFDIVLDEVHNLVHSRRAMSRFNTTLSKWIAQIRKMMGDSEKNHIYIISQNLMRIDVAWRDLIHTIVYCEKMEMNDEIPTIVYQHNKKKTKSLKRVYVVNALFSGHNCIDKFQQYVLNGLKTYDRRSYFLANPYYQYFDTHGLIEFGEEQWL